MTLGFGLVRRSCRDVRFSGHGWWFPAGCYRVGGAGVCVCVCVCWAPLRSSRARRFCGDRRTPLCPTHQMSIAVGCVSSCFSLFMSCMTLAVMMCAPMQLLPRTHAPAERGVVPDIPGDLLPRHPINAVQGLLVHCVVPWCHVYVFSWC